MGATTAAGWGGLDDLPGLEPVAAAVPEAAPVQDTAVQTRDDRIVVLFRQMANGVYDSPHQWRARLAGYGVTLTDECLSACWNGEE